MTRMIRIVVLTSLMFSAIFCFAQSTTNVPLMRRMFHENIDKAQKAIDKLDKKDDKMLHVSDDEAENSRATASLYAKIDEIQNHIESDSNLDPNAKVKFLRGLADALNNFETGVRRKTITLRQLPEMVMAFKVSQELEKQNASIAPVVEANVAEIGDILVKSYSFAQNPGIAKARDIILLKNCSNNPDQILPLLLKNPNVFFADSLIKQVAYTHQEDLYTYAQANNELGRRIRKSEDPLVKIISGLSVKQTGRLYFPFLDQLYKGQTTVDDLEKQMADDNKYYSLLVATQVNYAARVRNGDTPMAMQTLTGMLRKKAVDVYVNSINGLHESPDAIRFKSIEGLNPQELYYLCIMGEEDIYTSSYLGVYKRIFQKLKAASSDSLLASVHYDHFKKFIKMAANYNTLDDFLKGMDHAKSESLMRSFAAGLEKTDNLEDAVDVADSYASISNGAMRKLIMDEISTNYERVKSTSDKRGKVIYDILQTVFESMDSSKKIDISAKFGIPPVYSVRNRNLRDTSGRIIVQQFFYGDKDGVTVFNNFKAAYSNSNWKIINKPEWIEVVSTRGTPVTIYSNRPLDEEQDLDAKAQKSLGDYLYDKDLKPSVVIHRGHSYYVKYTIEQLAPSAKVVLLGSCGGYHALNEVLGICPYAHIIASKQVGSGTVNQPMIISLTETLRQGRDLNWPDMWKDFEKRFKGNERFDDYVPPYNNLGAIFIMVYNKTMEGEQEPNPVSIGML